MNILLASSEVHPYSKTGGLADMTGALGKALARKGHRVGIVTPLYRGIREKHAGLRKLDWWIDAPMGKSRIQADNIWIHEPEPSLTIYFVDQADLFDRKGIYQENGTDYPDNATRFIFFSKCVVNLARYLPWKPEIVHLHDWQVGLVPALMQQEREQGGWGNPASSCLTIHNLAYQGVFPKTAFELTNLGPQFFQPGGVEFHGYLNCLKAAIIYSDIITTVSPRYAREITTQEYGHGLDGTLRDRSHELVGILNGVDYEEWNTTDNPFLKAPYSVDDLSGKAQAKASIQNELGLNPVPDIPLFGNVTRMVDQKGVDILLGSLEEMLAAGMQFILLGSGTRPFEEAYLKLASRYPGKAGVVIGYNHGLAHRIEAGCDFYLMPSRFEPCGLNQMYSLKYGTLPIVRQTGGLDDSVIDVNESVEQANGIKFREYTARALSKAIRKGLELYRHPELMEHYRRNAMLADFSWDRTSAEYLGVYQQILDA